MAIYIHYGISIGGLTAHGVYSISNDAADEFVKKGSETILWGPQPLLPIYYRYLYSALIPLSYKKAL